MVYSQKYCLIQPLESMKVGDEFSRVDWPLHCTMAGVFALEYNDTTKRTLAELIGSHAVFSSTTGDVEYFGEDASVKVRLVEKTQKLDKLHRSLITYIQGRAGIFNEPHYLNDDFRPHVTMIKDEPAKGVPIKFSTLALIDMFPNGDPAERKVIAEFPLAESH